MAHEHNNAPKLQLIFCTLAACTQDHRHIMAPNVSVSAPNMGEAHRQSYVLNVQTRETVHFPLRVIVLISVCQSSLKAAE